MRKQGRWFPGLVCIMEARLNIRAVGTGIWVTGQKLHFFIFLIYGKLETQNHERSFSKLFYLLSIIINPFLPVNDSQANSADPDQTPHNVASDQGLQCLLTGFCIKNRIKATIRPDTPKMTNRLVQHITVEESTSIQWVKRCFLSPLQRETTFVIFCLLLLDKEPFPNLDRFLRERNCSSRSKFFPLRVDLN